MLADPPDHLHHLPSPTLFTVPVDQSFEQLIIARGPKIFFPPGGERFGSGEGARVSLQDIKVMLEFQNILLMSITPLVNSDPPPRFIDFYRRRTDSSLDSISRPALNSDSSSHEHSRIRPPVGNTLPP